MLKEIKVEADRNTIIVGDFNTPLTSMTHFPDKNQYSNRDPK